MGGYCMTRREQIIEASIEFSRSSKAHRLRCRNFEKGAEWADSHPNLSEEEQVGMGELGMMWQKKALINKACEWLVDNARNYIVSGSDGCWYDSVKLKHAFRKAMEE